jgi:glucose/arabinose dehydrogenase
MFTRLVRLSLIASALIMAVVVLPMRATVVARASFEVIASGLFNPRGLAFGPEGALYVAEAGRGGSGPCIQGAEGMVCYGPTGAIVRIDPLEAGSQSRVITGLPSLAVQPAGARAGGPQDIGFLGRGNGWVTIGLGNNPEKRDDLGAAGAKFARLLRFLPNGRHEYAEDLGAYELNENPDGGVPDTNPYGIAVLPSRTLFTDAGGNVLNEVAANGTISTLAVFPNRPVALGPATIQMQSVPTTVVRGPDGWLYVGQLTGFPFPVGGAKVYRVPPEGGTPVEYAGNFTNIIDIAFGPDGALYVLEIDSNNLRTAGDTGALIRVAANGARTTIASTGLTNPGGVAFGPDGAIYVTNMSVSPGGGQVLRVTP